MHVCACDTADTWRRNQHAAGSAAAEAAAVLPPAAAGLDSGAGR